MIDRGNSEKNHSALLSGNWNNAANAGTFNWNLNNAESNVNQNIGTHLANFVKYFLDRPAPWQNITTNKHCVGRARNCLEHSVDYTKKRINT